MAKENKNEINKRPEKFSFHEPFTNKGNKNYSITVESGSPFENDTKETNTSDIKIDNVASKQEDRPSRASVLSRALTMFHKTTEMDNIDENNSLTRSASFFVAKQFDHLKQFVQNIDKEAETRGFSFFECVKCM